ncbi:MAG: ABC transporter ATP-binding protein [candidate division NC10 bacterium]|nr:ABC transporter ATP-binding protein [candidate division NC10 bacterium]
MRIAVQNLTKRFGPLEAVSRVSLEIRDGELFTLLGPSGCGKTTLLRLLAGFYHPDEGDIRFGDRSVTDVPPYERRIGMVFQNYALWPHMTVFQNVAYGLKLRKLDRAEVVQRVQGGLQVALARALVLNPDILLLDEPLSNLDAKIRVQVRAEIRKLQKELGITTVYVTHDQEEALSLSDRIAVFNQGKVLQVGLPKELYERPTSRFVADFIGTNNMIEGTVRSVEPAQQRLRAETALGELLGLLDERLRPGERCILCIRPENASVNSHAEGESNVLKGKITFASYLGNTLRYDVEVGEGVVFKVDIRDPWHHQELPVGTGVTVSFPVSSTLAIPVG